MYLYIYRYRYICMYTCDVCYLLSYAYLSYVFPVTHGNYMYALNMFYADIYIYVMDVK